DGARRRRAGRGARGGARRRGRRARGRARMADPARARPPGARGM
ncbi:MAG: hypothetical protein AVDCRST_MAG85-3543, partial [uncultured Solirubrobacteraceae bacterium]